MNARVDPAALYEGGDDAKLIALCKASIRVLEEEIQLHRTRFDIEETFYTSRPRHPTLPSSQELGSVFSASQLRSFLEEQGRDRDAAWRGEVQALIEAVEVWDQDCTALRESLGLPEVERLCAMASKASKAYVAELPSMAAQTSEGAALKSMVLACWLEAGWGTDDLGEDLVRSIVEDIRRTRVVEGRSNPESPDNCRAPR